MKNVCMVLQKKLNVNDAGLTSVFDAFSLNGYAFDEVCILPQDDELHIKERIAKVKKETQILALVADKTALPIAKRYIVDSFPENTQQNAYDAAAIYQDKTCALLLVSADDSETGSIFIKKVAIPYIQKTSGIRYDKMTIRAVGANESRVEALLARAKQISGGRVSIARTRRYDEDVIQITYDSNSPKMLIDDVLRLFVDGLGDTVYAVDDVKLEEQIVNLAKLRRRKISLAESFTGGGIAKRLTSVSGASEIYFEGLNTYNEVSKIKRLGVAEYTLRTLGAVSDQTAYEMAYGLLNTGDCDVAVATTGLAGPKSDKSMQPVGLCYIAVGTKERIRVYRYIFDGDRKEITEKAINYALFFAYRQLKDM
jgi:nicotinamide-nucleotide amidase